MAVSFTEGEVKMVCLLIQHLDGPLNVDWEGAFKAGDYQNVNSLRSIWNKFKRTKLAPGENTSKKRKADKEGAEDGDGEAPTKKRGKGAGKDKKTDTDGVDGAGKGDDEAEDKVKTEGEDAI